MIHDKDRKKSFSKSAFSGRLKIAQRFIAGIGQPPIRSPCSGRLKRLSDRYHSAVRFTDYKSSDLYPSSELLGYYHSSATRTNRTLFDAKAKSTDTLSFNLLPMKGRVKNPYEKSVRTEIKSTSRTPLLHHPVVPGRRRRCRLG